MHKWLYEFLFVDQKTNTLSHTKFWSQIGYAIMCWSFPYAIINGSEIDYTLWILFGVVVIGNRTLIKAFIKNEQPRDPQ